ncbi:MAG: arsenite methyltransferase [Thermoplasmata archaeon]|nr:arsenite methyltransferase [Thermoplasmata archaeon]MCI4354318.1 arsenite methyltransferase [Thermoplasmata archaeon]
MSADAPPEAEPSADVRPRVRAHYARVAGHAEPCCGGSCCGGSGRCGGGGCGDPTLSGTMGYAAEELATLPEGADLGLGCGNPTGLLSLRPGETVLDLGSGGGIDCFLAARRVGPGGQVIGVDMTPEMIERARAAAIRGAYDRVEFRLGEIEHLPVADASVDVVLSNCVINLASDKGQVYREARRVLRPGGRLAVADMVATRPIPEEARRDGERWSACSSGAISVEQTRALLLSAGFEKIEITVSGLSAEAVGLTGPDDLGVVSASICALRPLG